MEGKLEEIYTQDGKKLSELIQEWIDENNNYFYCKRTHTDVKCKINR